MLELWVIRVFLSLLVLLHQVTAQTLTNITVDDTDFSQISYVGNWEPSGTHRSVLDIGGSHTLSEDPNGSATFTFTGVAVYYLAPKWPYTVDSYVALDGGAPVLVDMTGPLQASVNGEETVAADALWGATGLTNGVHRVVVTRGPSHYAVVDGFMYTSQSTSSTSRPVSTAVSTTTIHPDQGTSSTASQASSTSSATNQPQSNSTIIIIVTVTASVVCLILLVILIVFCMRRRKKSDAADRYSGGFGSGSGRGTTYNVPVFGANNYSNPTYSAVPLTENQLYTYPYSSGTVGSGVDMAGVGMVTHDSRYSTVGYSDSTTTGSPSGAGSLSAQQQMSHANAPLYGQEAYGLYPVSNRALVVPGAGGAATSSSHNNRVSDSGTDWYNSVGPRAGGYSGEGSGGYNTAAAYTGPGPNTATAVGPLDQPPSPLSSKARFEGSYTPYDGGHNIGDSGSQTAIAGYTDTASVTALPYARPPSPLSEKARYEASYRGHPYAGGVISPSEPPPSYADRLGPSGAPASPPRTNKRGFI